MAPDNVTITIEPDPRYPDTHSRCIVSSRTRNWFTVWAGVPTEAEVRQAWVNNRNSFKPYRGKSLQDSNIGLVFSDIQNRYNRIDTAVRKGELSFDDAIGEYAWLSGDNHLSLARSNAAEPEMADESDASVPFTISTYEEDRDGDIVVPMGCDLTDYSKNPVIFFGHQSNPIPIAKSKSPDGRLTVYPEENRIRAVAYFDKADSDAMFLYGKVVRGYLNASSIAFVPLEAYKRDDIRKAHQHDTAPNGWVFKRFSMTEWSIVGVPANAGAIRDSLDSEKSFITPRMQKALLPYCAKSMGCWNGWCDLSKVKSLNTKTVVKSRKRIKKKKIGQYSYELFESKDDKTGEIEYYGTVWNDATGSHTYETTGNAKYRDQAEKEMLDWIKSHTIKSIQATAKQVIVRTVGKTTMSTKKSSCGCTDCKAKKPCGCKKKSGLNSTSGTAGGYLLDTKGVGETTYQDVYVRPAPDGTFDVMAQLNDYTGSSVKVSNHPSRAQAQRAAKEKRDKLKQDGRLKKPNKSLTSLPKGEISDSGFTIVTRQLNNGWLWFVKTPSNVILAKGGPEKKEEVAEDKAREWIGNNPTKSLRMKSYKIVQHNGENTLGGNKLRRPEIRWVIEDETGDLVDGEFYKTRQEAEKFKRQYEEEDRREGKKSLVSKSKCPQCGSNVSNGECSSCGWFGENALKTKSSSEDYDTGEDRGKKDAEEAKRKTGKPPEKKQGKPGMDAYDQGYLRGWNSVAKTISENTYLVVKGDWVVDNKGGYKVVQFHDGYQTMYKVVNPNGKTLDEFESLSVASKYAENMRSMKSISGNTYMKTPKKKSVAKGTKKAPIKKKAVDDEQVPDIATDNEDPAEDTSTPFEPMPGAKVIASLHSHAKSEHDYLNDELSKMDNPGAREDLQKYLSKHVEPRMEHLEGMMSKHYPDHEMEATQKAMESDGDTTDNYAEEAMVDDGEVPPDSVENDMDDVPMDDNVEMDDGDMDLENPDETTMEQEEDMDEGGVADDTTEEILERYREPKSNKWSTRKIGTLHRLKDGRTYLVREKAIGGLEVVQDDDRKWYVCPMNSNKSPSDDNLAGPFNNEQDAKREKQKIESRGKSFNRKDLDNDMPDEMGMSLENEGNPTEITPDHTETIGKAADHMEALSNAPDLPSHHCAGLSHHATKLKDLLSDLESKDLTDQGNPTETGGYGDGLDNQGNPNEMKDLDNEGNPAELGEGTAEMKDEEDEEKMKSKKRLSTPVVNKFNDMVKRFELLTNMKLNGG